MKLTGMTKEEIAIIAYLICDGQEMNAGEVDFSRYNRSKAHQRVDGDKSWIR